MIREHHLQVARTARYYTLGESAGSGDLWMVLHGYGQLAARFARHFAPLAETGRLVVAPEGLSRFYLDGTGRHGPDSRVGASWMTREDRLAEIDDYVGYLDAVCAAAAGTRRVVAFGFSQGTATATRWALRGRTPVHRLVLWAGLFPADVDLAAERERLSRLGLVIVVGETDEFADRGRVSDAEAALKGAGIPYRLVSFPGGHRLHRETLLGLADL